ncbi:RWD domain-containing protein 4-like [Actinia tenebrosa]|uniref:RWD domain-containing protein 4-like n=1 Tax=Actinia tenebrosa TaxID=6105 RepID=A0A6P8HZV0_ACTTE|nr:RWD domain-containing protein 4-like [Actinia tenebrosa]
MDCKVEQEEEREVLRSIYEEDERFKEINPTTFQYKFGEDGHFKSFVLEISWTDNYPENAPNINMDAFYNKHLLDKVKGNIISRLSEQCDLNLGCAMTYSLFDWTNEHCEELTEEQDEAQQPLEAPESSIEEKDNQDNEQKAEKTEKKEKLTKNQKRKLGNRLNAKGELERGWNWVDIVKHLSKTKPT